MSGMPTQAQEAGRGEEARNRMEHSPLLETARKVLLASIGAVALAQDEIEEFVDKLVERGEIADKEGKGLLREVMDRRRKQIDRVNDMVARRVDEALRRSSIPTRSDFEALSEKIAEITRKVDELKKSSS